MILVTAQGVGLVNFALIPHLDHEDHPELPWATPKSGPRGYPCQRTRSTTRPR
jgi:hypothetical protein